MTSGSASSSACIVGPPTASPTRHGPRDVVLPVEGQSEQAGEAERRAHPPFDGGPEVLAAETFDQLHQHPVRRTGVVFEAGARLPVESPRCQPFETACRVRSLGRPHGGVGEPAGVQEHLLDGHLTLAVRGELRHVVRHGARHVECALADELPHARRHDRLRHRERQEAVGIRGRPEGLEQLEFAVAGDGDLTGGQPAGVDVASRRIAQGAGAGRCRGDVHALTLRCRRLRGWTRHDRE